MLGRIFEIREFTLQDGPGVRTTVFLKGCPLRCVWCHNPEGQSFDFDAMHDKNGNVRRCGNDWSARDLANEILVNADIMLQSGGGVTFSGGEPLSQADFLLETISLLKPNGINIAIETSGYVDSETYKRVISQVDFVYQDIKHHDAAKFKLLTGGDLQLVLNNIAYLKACGAKHVFRTPLIPRVNDSEDDKRRIRNIAGDDELQFLPFNPLAGAKYKLLNRQFPLALISAERE